MIYTYIHKHTQPLGWGGEMGWIHLATIARASKLCAYHKKYIGYTRPRTRKIRNNIVWVIMYNQNPRRNRQGRNFGLGVSALAISSWVWLNRIPNKCVFIFIPWVLEVQMIFILTTRARSFDSASMIQWHHNGVRWPNKFWILLDRTKR